MSKEDWYTIEESRALLLEVWPNWPDPRGKQPAPDVNRFLAELRANKEAGSVSA